MKTRYEREYEERVKRRVLILKDLMNEGKMLFAENLKESIEESFSKARYDKNGVPDLSTIDGKIRSIALMAEHFDHREKAKDAVSLYQIQEHYFKFFEVNFQTFYNLIKEKNLSIHEVAEFAGYNHTNDYLNNSIENIIEHLTEFWNSVAEAGYYHLQDQNKSIKAVFGGELFPSSSQNIASKSGIFTDTIILPCPIIRTQHMFKVWDKQERVYHLVSHALNILQYKELALADLDKPIVVILADKEMIDEFSLEQVQKLGENDALHHAKQVFGREFESIEELVEFGESLDTVDKVIKEIKDESKVLFDTEFTEPLSIQIENQINGISGQIIQTKNPGIIVTSLGLGRMCVSNELLLKSASVGDGVPLIDAPTSWEYFKWKLEYDNQRVSQELNVPNSHIVHGLNQLKNTNLKWIGKMPAQGLIEIRKSGAIDEIRSILSKGIQEIATANYLDYDTTTRNVYENLNLAFENHETNIQELIAKKWSIAGKDIGSWIVMGTLEISAAYTGTPLYGLSTAILSQLVDAPKLKDLPKSLKTIKQLEIEKQNLNKSPIGIMLQYK